MSERLLELATRRGELTARIAMQRATIAAHAYPLAGVLGVADQAAAGVEWLKRRPAIIAAAVAVFVVLRPGRVLRWGRSVLFVWRGVRLLRNKVRELV